MPKFYTGIGSRETPPEILDLMQRIAKALAHEGWVVRSGGAPGADHAFGTAVAAESKRIYLPWNGFQDLHHGRDGAVVPERFATTSQLAQAQAMAQRHHPAWDKLRDPVRKLMTRNAFQIMGDDMASPSTFVLCWAPNPKVVDERVVDVKGGTGLAVRLAAEQGVPVYHFEVHADRLNAWLASIENKMLAATLVEQAQPGVVRPRL